MDDLPDNNVLELCQIVSGEPDMPAQISTSEDTNTERPKQGEIWAYLGVVGGAGVTSLAIQTAWELSIRGGSKNKTRVLLVDMDFERGDCAAYLDIAPGMSIAELNDTEGRMDENLAATFIRSVNPDLSLLSARSELGGNDLVSPAAFLSLLDNISGMYDFIILDVPPMWRPWTQAAIGAADKFALVTEARVPALHQARKTAEDICTAMSLPDLPKIILSKYERRSLRGGLNLGDAHKALGHETCTQICIDEETLRSAINTGKPPGVLKPNSRYVKSVRNHVQNWNQAHTDFNVGSQQYERRSARR